MGFLEAAAATLVGGERKIAAVAHNIANATTPTYKSEITYSVATSANVEYEPRSKLLPVVSTISNTAQGRLIATEKAYDLAIDGTGFIVVRKGSSYFLSRGGELKVAADGKLQDALGRVVQQSGGGDLDVPALGMEILPDGTVLGNGVPLGSIGLFEAKDRLPERALSVDEIAQLEEASGSELKQGMLEQSNVTMPDEMVELMRSQRQVESGAQLVRTYDQLMSQAISTFGRNGS